MRESEDPEIKHIQERSTKVGIKDPEKDRRDLETTILIVVVFLAIIIPLFLTFYLMTSGEAPAPCCHAPTGQFASASATSNTTATVVFAGFSSPPSPENIRIALVSDSAEGIYVFDDYVKGTVLTLDRGNNVGVITYHDYARNERIDSGDELRIPTSNQVRSTQSRCCGRMGR